VKGNLNILHIP